MLTTMSQYDEYHVSEMMMSSPKASSGYLEDVLFQFRPKPSSSKAVEDYSTSSPPFDMTSPIKEYCSWTSDLIQNFDEITKFHKNSEENNEYEIRKKRRLLPKVKVVCPFALVKPGGFEGATTLDEINERILMPPTRPVRHPVGDFACRPLVSPDGPGLSGKAVVSFTRIQTQGRGTITIVRTRG